MKGCNLPASRVVAEYSGFYKFKRCPGALKSGWAREILSMHLLWSNGVMPFEGGALDQPAKIVEAMQLIDALKAQHQRDLESKAKKWQKTKSASSSRLNKAKR